MDIQPLHTKIEKTIQTSYGTVVMEHYSGFPRGESNIYCVDPGGKILWFAEKPDPLYALLAPALQRRRLDAFHLHPPWSRLRLGHGNRQNSEQDQHSMNAFVLRRMSMESAAALW